MNPVGVFQLDRDTGALFLNKPVDREQYPMFVVSVSYFLFYLLITTGTYTLSIYLLHFKIKVLQLSQRIFNAPIGLF